MLLLNSPKLYDPVDSSLLCTTTKNSCVLAIGRIHHPFRRRRNTVSETGKNLSGRVPLPNIPFQRGRIFPLHSIPRYLSDSWVQESLLCANKRNGFVSVSDPKKFSLRSFVSSTVITTNAPAKCVAHTSRVKSTLFHGCRNVPGYVSIKVPEMLNFMLHLRYVGFCCRLENIPVPFFSL